MSNPNAAIHIPAHSCFVTFLLKKIDDNKATTNGFTVINKLNKLDDTNFSDKKQQPTYKVVFNIPSTTNCLHSTPLCSSVRSNKISKDKHNKTSTNKPRSCKH